IRNLRGALSEQQAHAGGEGEAARGARSPERGRLSRRLFLLPAAVVSRRDRSVQGAPQRGSELYRPRRGLLLLRRRADEGREARSRGASTSGEAGSGVRAERVSRRGTEAYHRAEDHAGGQQNIGRLSMRSGTFVLTAAFVTL